MCVYTYLFWKVLKDKVTTLKTGGLLQAINMWLQGFFYGLAV